MVDGGHHVQLQYFGSGSPLHGPPTSLCDYLSCAIICPVILHSSRWCRVITTRQNTLRMPGQVDALEGIGM